MRGSMSAKTGTAALVQEAVRARGERVRRRDDLVAGPDPGRDAEQMQARGARGDGGRVGRADALGHELLEAVDRRPERESARAQHLEHELLLALAEIRPRERDRRHLLLHAGSAAWLGAAGRAAAPGWRPRRLQRRWASRANSSHWLQRSLRPCTVSRYACWISCVTGPGRADHLVVDLADRRHLGGRPDHEHLVGEVQVGADERLLDDAVAEILRDLDHGVARDADEDRRGEVGRVDHAVADDEDALARAVGDGALRGEEDRLVVAGAVGLAHGEHRVHVDAGRLRDVRDDVRADALPARDLGADPVPLALFAEIRAPGPRHDRDVDGVPHRRHAELAVADEGDRPQVAGRQLVGADHVPGRRLQLLDRVREVEVEKLRRPVQPLEVVGEAEDGRAALGLVGADPLEDARAVVQAVRADVDGRVGPVDQLAVHPDLLRLAHLRLVPSVAWRSANRTGAAT